MNEREAGVGKIGYGWYGYRYRYTLVRETALEGVFSSTYVGSQNVEI